MHPTRKPATSVPEPPERVETPAGVLRHAALYLTRYGWTQRDFYTYAHGDELLPSACLVGAIRAAVCGKPCRSTDTNSQAREIRAAEFLIADHLGLGPDTDIEAADMDAGDIEDRLTGWNDETGRTPVQVITELVAAADAYDRDAAALDYFIQFPGGAQ